MLTPELLKEGERLEREATAAPWTPSDWQEIPGTEITRAIAVTAAESRWDEVDWQVCIFDRADESDDPDALTDQLEAEQRDIQQANASLTTWLRNNAKALLEAARRDWQASQIADLSRHPANFPVSTVESLQSLYSPAPQKGGA